MNEIIFRHGPRRKNGKVRRLPFSWPKCALTVGTRVLLPCPKNGLTSQISGV
jgi:hypothetical protein